MNCHKHAKISMEDSKMDWLSIKEFFKDTIKYFLIVIVFLFVAIYVIGLQQVVGPSMSPNLENNDI